MSSKSLFIVSALILLADQISKLFIRGSFPFIYNGLAVGNAISIVPNHFSITSAENSGIAVGLDFGICPVYLFPLYLLQYWLAQSRYQINLNCRFI